MFLEIYETALELFCYNGLAQSGIHKREREPIKEIIGKGELLYLWHPETKDTFSGYGLTLEPDRKNQLVGILMIDRPSQAEPKWLEAVLETYGECLLVPMTATGERGLICQMEIEEDSLPHLRRFPSEISEAIQNALEALLEEPPAPKLRLRWDEETQLWHSEFAGINELPPDIREVFEKMGYGCLAAETNVGIVHVCHASDADIEGFVDKPVRYQWQLIKMPTAPLIRLDITILDRPENPFKFESFLNVAAADQAQVLADLANQDKLYLAMYGDDLKYRYTKVIDHGKQQWQQLDEIAIKAMLHWLEIPKKGRDFDQAKTQFMLRNP